MSDLDISDLSSDEESDIHDLEQLNAVLNGEEPYPTGYGTLEDTTNSIYSASSSYGEYSKYETALSLNKMCDEKLRRLEGILQVRLVETNRRLAELQKNTEVDKFDRENFRYVNCGKPYFKDSRGFPAPDNEDTIMMNKYQMYNCSGISSVPGWTVKDKCHLTTLIHKMSKGIKKKELEAQISNLKRENKLMKSIMNNKAISDLRREISAVDKAPLKALALPIDEEYDWDYVANTLSDRHSAQEYRSLWKLFLHPSINKNIWTRSEHTSLQKIAFERNLEDWDAISQELGTGRTNYQCFVYFRTNMNNTFTSRKWTKEEEEYLKRLIEYYKEDNYIPWGKVAATMENRTKVQIYNKFSRLSELRKGKFLPEEDSVILTCVQHFGPNFRKVIEYLQGRSVTQCRDRYHVLMKQRFSAVWTVDEDRKLVQLIATQDASTNFSTVSQYFPGKDRVNIRSRYITLSRWMRRNPNVNIANAPRRGARRLGHGKSTEDLNRAIECLKKRLQSEVSDKKKKKITRDSPDDVIDDAIVAVITTENMRLMEARKLQTCQEEVDSYADEGEIKNCNVTILQKILILLKAKLNRHKFANSPARNTYQGLLDQGGVTKLVQFRSYSKNNAVKYNKLEKNKNKVDIWGNVTLGQLAYVLPPHYATIIGCKKLMSYYISPKSEKEETKNINVLIKRNMMVKAQVNVLMERFNSLFLWPMLLSNASPEDFKTDEKINVLPGSVRKLFGHETCNFLEDYQLVLPQPNLRTLSKVKNAEKDAIDLVEESNDTQTIDDGNFFDSIL